MPSLAPSPRCAVCGDPCPHLFRIQGHHGLTDVCADCKPVRHFPDARVLPLRQHSEAAEHEGEWSGHMAGVHGSTVGPFAVAALVNSGADFQAPAQIPNR